MEMSRLIDVESGLPDAEDADNLQPLLGINPRLGANGTVTSNGSGYPAAGPDRPQRLGPFIEGHMEPPHHQRLLKLTAMTPSSTASTPGSTPTPATASNPEPRRWRRSDRRLRRLNTELLEAIEAQDADEVEKLLNRGANPNATCRLDLVSAVHMAALVGGRSLELLLAKGAERHRLDKLGRTPLHVATYAGNCRQVAVLLDFPQDIQDRVDRESMSSGAEEDIRKLNQKSKLMANVPCDLGEVKMMLPKDWKDNIDHNCKSIEGSLPLFKPGWTPLHVASARARRQCTKLLLAAGANPNAEDLRGCTPLDVAGADHFHAKDIENESFTEVIKMLLKAGAKHNTMKPSSLNNLDTPLHVAAEMECLEIIKELLDAGVSIACLNPAGETALHVCVRKELEDALQILANSSNNDQDPFAATVDVKDAEGHTVLQAAVEAAWVPGVCIALEAGADVTLKANDGETPIHSAAAMGNLDVLNEILSVAKIKSSIDCQNTSGETPLFMAIKNGHVECVKAILNEGASIKITLPSDVNVFHRAAELGNIVVIQALIDHDRVLAKEMINAICTCEKKGLGPIHYAVLNNHPKCVEFLLANGADVRLRTSSNYFKASTPLHLAAQKNYLEVANIILNYDRTTIHEVNSIGWFPLHTAAHHGSREIIPVLLQSGADLAGYTDGPKKYRRTALDMIINNLSKPTEYLEEIFDSYVTANNHNLQDSNCCVKLDYSILMPRSCEMEQMKVIEALLKTGNRYNQKRLLVHPLLESFLYFKWKALLPFFYTILFCYAFFLFSLTIFVVSVFFYKDTKEDPPVWLNSQIWGYVVYASILIILLQELLYMNVKSSRYFLQLETWIKFGSIGLATLLPPAVTIASWSAAEWPRHVATLALLLSWIEMMFLLSRFPNWGYFVLMFGKVATNVVKILLTFAFLVVGFSLSFMVQFHSVTPFEGPWSALVKTIVMMTSEFDYEALFDEEHAASLSTSIQITRIVFVVFLILASIVLMNLMVGVAVNDINDLEILGNIRRLAKQVEFLGTLDILVYNRFFSKILPKKINNSIRKKRNVPPVIEIYPGRPRWRHTKMLPSRLRDDVFNKATKQMKQSEEEFALHLFTKKITEIHEILTSKEIRSKDKAEVFKVEGEDKFNRMKKRHDEIMKHLNQLDSDMTEMKDQINLHAEESKSPLDEVNVKIDQMSIDIEGIKQCLSRLESKFGSL